MIPPSRGFLLKLVFVMKATKSLSEKFSGPKGNPGTRKMEQRQIILHFFLPPDEQPPKAVHPGVRALDVSTTILLSRHCLLWACRIIKLL
jgi:hypothetical protein